MPSFSQISQDRLATCHKLLQDVFNEVVKDFDISILCGFRNEHDQMEAVAKKMSKTRWPNSKHNVYPSMAVDVAPYPIGWDDPARFYKMAALALEVAAINGIKMRWGGNWTVRRVSDLVDLPHFELWEGG